MIDLKYVLTTRYNKWEGKILQDLALESGNLEYQVATWVFDTRDKASREALIALGWTPPETAHIPSINPDKGTYTNRKETQ